ncbi:3-deoxy-D-manno-octulosonic acid transferase [Euzebyella saccharophila]|uniref:3-deoxy-D-manno-octulosonic acid transferase n=1 Tax=Euzebyella saccharophila TaxID=679664 RepID=A0ABV8JMY0_9FLAO|nr:glycosyltransferase N-terminal domain-containing protein [Euzebyella saccharophila]
MHFIYNVTAQVSWFILRLVALFNTKINLFVEGRKQTLSILKDKLSPNEGAIWVHVASLGEFEQGLPIIEQLKIKYPQHKILVTFFSPSGYEVKKNTKIADAVCYLPIDTKKNAQDFIDKVNPVLALFVKYEVWPNYLSELSKRKIPILLVSAIFNENKIYFKPYGKFMRLALKKFDHIFVQDNTSQLLLNGIGINNTTVSGDTRLDRVSKILERDNQLDFMEAFKKERLCFVAGSTWPEDENILVDYINNSTKNIKFVLAPHTIKSDKIHGLAGAISKKTMLYSKMNSNTIGEHDVLIIDHIGLLTKIYSYAEIAYVGGGFATGLHNTLEPAVFGIPVIIGPKFKGFNEAEDLVASKGILSITDQWTFGETMKKLTENTEFRERTGKINANYISKNKGASSQIIQKIDTILTK